MLNKSCAARRFVYEGALKPVLALALMGPLLWGLVLAAPAHAQKKRDDAPVTVITAPVIETANRQRFDGVGTGVAQKRVDLYPNVAETVTAIGFKAGERVAKDALLIQLDDRAEKLALSLAEIQLKEAKSLLGRFTQAAKDGAVPDSEVDAARTEFEAAKIALEQARLARDMRQLRAPFAGVMGLPQVEIGDRVDTSPLSNPSSSALSRSGRSRTSSCCARGVSPRSPSPTNRGWRASALRWRSAATCES